MKPTIPRRTGLVTIIAAVLAISVFFLPAAGCAAWSLIGSGGNFLPNDPGQFNGLRWGQYLGELKGMRLTSYDPRNPAELYYANDGDVLQMGDVKLAYVRYGFWRGIYSSLVFGVEGLGNWEALKAMCFERFEFWHKPDWRVERYYWVGDQSAMTLDYNEVTYQGELYIYSKTIYERQLAQRKPTGGIPHNRFWLY